MSELSAKVPEILIRTDAQFKERDFKMPGLMELIVEIEKKEEAIVIEKFL